MKKKWFHIFSKEKEAIEVSLVGDRQKSLLELVSTHEKRRNEKIKEEELNRSLMEGILQFREETKALDYIRDEIEQVMYKKDGEVNLMEGFARTLSNQKQGNP